MELEEFEQQRICSACGDRFWGQQCPEFSSGYDYDMCANCANSNGGIYNPSLEVWKRDPTLTEVIQGVQHW